MTEPDNTHQAAPYSEAFRLDTPFGPCVGIALPSAGRFSEDQKAQLHPQEAAFAESLSDLRARTYVGGRLALRAAIRLAGLKAEDPVLTGSAGEPQLPADIWGSISHKQDLAVAVACRAQGRGALGIDLETNQPGRIDIAPRVLVPEELAALAHLAEPERWRQTRQAFSAKEAIYKAGYPLAQRFFGFKEAQLTLPFLPDLGQFHSIVTKLLPSGWTPDFALEVIQYVMPSFILSLACARGNTKIPLRNNGLHSC
jgi:4'-phosphopantetheinyl transferase EntD